VKVNLALAFLIGGAYRFSGCECQWKSYSHECQGATEIRSSTPGHCQALENNESLPFESKYNESLQKQKLVM
jgi:hypothetical protein